MCAHAPHPGPQLRFGSALPAAGGGRVGAATAIAFLILTLLAFTPALAQTFPALTGRVVDAANILKPEDRIAIEAKLKAYEDKTSDQVVVATIPSLEGASVEDYANRLYRAWQLGTKEKNNGALLLVAPNDRKVRIEVGYGLEGALTDALTGIIIRTAIAPKFKAGDFAGGIQAGVDGMLAVLAGDAEEWQRKGRPPRSDEWGPTEWLTVFWVVLVLFLILRAFSQEVRGISRSHRQRNGRWVTLPGPSSSGWGGGFGGGGFSGGGSFGGGGGGFSGGGGSSGGGGASGSW